LGLRIRVDKLQKNIHLVFVRALLTAFFSFVTSYVWSLNLLCLAKWM